MGLNVIVAPTEAEALAKRDEYLSYASAEAGVAHFSVPRVSILPITNWTNRSST